MTVRYLDLFREAVHEATTGAYRRPRGQIQLPPFMGTWKDRLPKPLRILGRKCKRWLHRGRSVDVGLFSCDHSAPT
jgi:hypothetical protein